MKETRTEYLSRITAENPGAYHRIDDMMRSWDAANREAEALAATEPEEPVSASEETPIEE